MATVFENQNGSSRRFDFGHFCTFDVIDVFESEVAVFPSHLAVIGQLEEEWQ